MLELSICLARLGNVNEFLTKQVDPYGHAGQRMGDAKDNTC